MFSKQMKNTVIPILISMALSTLIGCSSESNPENFGDDLNFLKAHKKVIVLKSENDLCQVAIVPDYQGRVMTSTSNGPEGKSYGWINYKLIESNQFEEHINVFGGEDRFWMGPEGGQFSIFFEKDKEFTLDHWNTPKAIDTEPFEVKETTDGSAAFTQEMRLLNYQNFEFDILVERLVSIFEKDQIEENLKMRLPAELSFVAYQSKNKISNIGSKTWTKESGLLSIWILGMFQPSDQTTIILPYKDSLMLNTSYFGEISSDRLKVTDQAVFFKGDGKYRCKIGLPPQNALTRMGSYDAENGLLTIVEYSFAGDSIYVNSLWELQDEPYRGDVVNSYNDGPFEDGSQLGPFYELESSSSAKELEPGQAMEHIHKTYHFEGAFELLNMISKGALGVDLNQIK